MASCSGLTQKEVAGTCTQLRKHVRIRDSLGSLVVPVRTQGVATCRPATMEEEEVGRLCPFPHHL